MTIKNITTNDLRKMNNKEGLILQGCGGEVKEWVDPLGTLVGIQTFITPKGRHYLLILLDSEGFYDE